MLFLQSPLDLLQRISLRQARQDPRTGKGLVGQEGLVRSDGLAEIGDGVLLRSELGDMGWGKGGEKIGGVRSVSTCTS
jgi:hypothetical protein